MALTSPTYTFGFKAFAQLPFPIATLKEQNGQLFASDGYGMKYRIHEDGRVEHVDFDAIGEGDCYPAP